MKRTIERCDSIKKDERIKPVLTGVKFDKFAVKETIVLTPK
jgi:hypothetical protein